MPENEIIRGTPPPILMPAHDYKFEVIIGKYIIKLPREGDYHDLDPKFFDEDAGKFNIFNDENNTLYLPAITKVLFATSQYPDLPTDHCFAPYAIQIVEDGVIVIGQILKFLEDPSKIYGVYDKEE